MSYLLSGSSEFKEQMGLQREGEGGVLVDRAVKDGG